MNRPQKITFGEMREKGASTPATQRANASSTGSAWPLRLAALSTATTSGVPVI
jgi:hypothetical protein